MEKFELSHVSYCETCKKYHYPNAVHPNMPLVCAYCGGNLVDTGKTMDQLDAERPSTEELFLKRMREMKETDPVKYEISMERYKKRLREQKLEANKVSCPKCGCTQISANRRGWKITTGFLGSSKIINTCMNCGYEWRPGKR